MKIQAFLLSTLMFTLTLGTTSGLQAQTSNDLLINDTSSDYNLGYQAGTEAARRGNSQEPTNVNSRAYLDGYRDGYRGRSANLNQLTVDLNNGQDCLDPSHKPSSAIEEINIDSEGRGDFQIDLNTGEANCTVK